MGRYFRTHVFALAAIDDPKLWISQVIPDNYHLSEADILRFCTTEQQLRQAILDLQEAWRAERFTFAVLFF